MRLDIDTLEIVAPPELGTASVLDSSGYPYWAYGW